LGAEIDAGDGCNLHGSGSSENRSGCEFDDLGNVGKESFNASSRNPLVEPLGPDHGVMIDVAGGVKALEILERIGALLIALTIKDAPQRFVHSAKLGTGYHSSSQPADCLGVQKPPMIGALA
jgi:hypothetical protein